MPAARIKNSVRLNSWIRCPPGKPLVHAGRAYYQSPLLISGHVLLLLALLRHNSPKNMAQNALERAQKRMDAETEQRIAALLRDGAAQLSEAAERKGVSAFCRRPLMRERPNSRFLLNTLRGVQTANRRAQEEEMWAAREQLRRQPSPLDRSQQHNPRRRSSPQNPNHASGGHDHPSPNRSHKRRSSPFPSPSSHTESPSSDEYQKRACPPSEPRHSGSVRSPHSRSLDSSCAQQARPASSASVSITSSSSSSDDSSGAVGLRARPGQRAGSEDMREASSEGMDDEELMEMLSKRRVRGRGDVGSRLAEPGPYLPDPGGAEAGTANGGEVRRMVGPARPEWLQKQPGGGRGRGYIFDPLVIDELRFQLGLRPAGAGMADKAGPGKESRKRSKEGRKKDKKRKRGKEGKKDKRRREKKEKSRKHRRVEEGEVV